MFISFITGLYNSF